MVIQLDDPVPEHIAVWLFGSKDKLAGIVIKDVLYDAADSVRDAVDNDVVFSEPVMVDIPVCQPACYAFILHYNIPEPGCVVKYEFFAH